MLNDNRARNTDPGYHDRDTNIKYSIYLFLTYLAGAILCWL